jgi:hypothetical protein
MATVFFHYPLFQAQLVTNENAHLLMILAPSHHSRRGLKIAFSFLHPFGDKLEIAHIGLDLFSSLPERTDRQFLNDMLILPAIEQ